MRAIDADAIEYTHAVARNLFDGYNWNELVVTKDEIEDMPTIQPEITHEQAVEYLQSTGWLQEHDRQMMLDGVHRLTIRPEPHWIPVTERLPNKEEKSYWVCLEGGGQCQCRWTNDVYGLGANEWSKWGWKKVDLPQYSKVVAYMPLPEPYNGGDG